VTGIKRIAGNIQQSAVKSDEHVKLVTVNLSKTNEIVFTRPCQLRYNLVPSVDGVALVDDVKSLGVTLQQRLSFALHVIELFSKRDSRSRSLYAVACPSVCLSSVTLYRFC